MRVIVVEALSDNLMYMVIDEKTNRAVVVDPVEPHKVVSKAIGMGVLIVAVLTTHHHWDHAGGNLKIAELFPGLPVYGGDERIDGLSKLVSHGEILEYENLKIKCLHTPCHTTGHMCYYITDISNNSPGAVFTGDTLFIGGCGRFFEGTAEDMVKGLLEILGTLPDDTDVYCGHEYTVNNMKFAVTIEPQNKYITEMLAWAQEKRRVNEVTVPSTIGKEKLHNPFMRVGVQSVQRKVVRSDVVETMHVLRNMKNEFTP